MPNRQRRVSASVLLALAALLLSPAAALAHCDGLDGPVVKAARQALATNNVSLVLVWVQRSDETEIRKAFAETLAVRALDPAARKLADRTVQHGLEQRFKLLEERKAHAGRNVEAGREYVREYVDFLHFVERVHQAAEGATPEHAPVQHAHD